MPHIQILPSEETTHGALARALGSLAGLSHKRHLDQQDEEKKLQKIQQLRQKSGSALQSALSNLPQDASEEQKIMAILQSPEIDDSTKNMANQFYKEHEKTQNAQRKSEDTRQRNRALTRDIEKKRGLEEGSLDVYSDDPKMAEQITRTPKTKVSESPVPPDQMEAIRRARSTPGFDEMDEIQQYRTLIDNNVSPVLSEKEAKLKTSQLERNEKSIESAYKNQKDFIDSTTSKNVGFQTEMKPRLLQMQKLNDEELIGATSAAFLEAVGIPLGAIDNPESELYQKLSQDLLKGLPETYGNRILKVEVDNFLKTIPTLLNSPEGKRMIATNMLKLGEMKEVYYNEMRRQQMDFENRRVPLPRDFEQRVFDNVLPEINRINNEFLKLSDIKSVPKDHIPFFNPQGEVSFVPKQDAEWAEKNGGRRIW